MTGELIERSIPATTRLPRSLNNRVETLIKERNFGSKSRFLTEAARFYVEFCERINLDQVRQQEVDRFYEQQDQLAIKTQSN